MNEQKDQSSATDWAGRRLLPIFEAPIHLEIYDVRSASYDVQLSVATLAGLVNRCQPRVYLLSDDDAQGLFDDLLAHIPHEHITTTTADALHTMLTTYGDVVKGIIIYDPALPDSVNVGTTMAGLRDAILVSPQQAETLQQKPHQLPVIADLRSYHWKNRLQAYRWAERNLLKESPKQVFAGLAPRIASGLRSYLVATRAFVYWLNPFDFWLDPASGWTTERCQMKRIVRAFQPGTPHMGWVVNEFGGVHMASKSALPIVASDYFYNLEVWTAIQPPTSVNSDVVQDNPRSRPDVARLTDDQKITPKVYVSFTISDGDNLQFTQHRMHLLWQDPARGGIPLGWTIAPLLPEAAPTLAAYYQQTASPNDELIAGPSGAGYIWPSSWPGNQLSAFTRLTGTLMQRMGLRTIEVLDGPLSFFFPFRAWQEQYAKLLSPFGLQGLLCGDSYRSTGWRVVSGIAAIKNLGLVKTVAETLKLINNNIPSQLERPQFISVYIYAWTMTPTDIKKVIQGLDSRCEVVTPGQLCDLIAWTPQ